MNRILIFLGLFIGLLFFQSCILKEFKGDKVHLKDDWEMEVIVPLFHGDFTFADLVHNWDTIIPLNDNQVTVLKFSPDSFMTIPSQIIFESSVIIDGFNFLIEGDDYLSSADFIYTINNTSPFALNFQMRFFNKETPAEKGPAILPPSFLEGYFVNGELLPSESVNSITLTALQLESFKAGNRIEFSTWFERPETGFSIDTLLATWPVNVSVVFSGKLHGQYE